LNKYREELLESHRSASWDKTHGCFTVTRLVKRFKVKVMAEIGVCYGHTASEVLSLNQVEKYYMVGVWQKDDNYFRVRNNFHDKAVEIFREDSMTAINRIEDEILDLVYINAGNTYKRTLEDLCGWSRKLKVGGILIGNGFNHPKNIDFGVKKALFRVFSKEHINVNLGEDSNYWIVKEEM